VDDNSDDGTQNINKEECGVENLKIFRNEKQQMMVKSRNIEAKEALGKYILFIDDDNEIDKDMIKVLTDFADSHEDFGIIGPSMYFSDSKRKYLDYQKICLYTGRTRGLIGDGSRDFYESDGIPNVFLIKKEVFEKCGYFDESIIQTFTEPDFAKNAEKYGFKCCIVPKAKTYHKIKGEKSFDPMGKNQQFSQKAYCSMRNRTVYISRYGNIVQKFVYLFFFSWFWPLVYSFFSFKSKRYDLIKLYWMGFIDGIIYFFTGKLKNSVEIK
jgi:GT2 family glycosyltransferase